MKGLHRLLFVMFAVCAFPAQAAFHLFRIDQVFSNADGTIQYIELRESTGTNNESFWQGNPLTTTGGPGGMQQIVFPSNLPSSNTASKSVLVATSGFAALNLVTPDYTIPANFVPVSGGTLNYANVDQIALPALPTDGATAIDRNGAHVAAMATNFAGVSAAVNVAAAPPPPPSTPDLDQQGLTGSWFEAAESGQGFEIEVYPDLIEPGTGLLQGAWFTFDRAPAGGADHQRWYTFNGHAQRGDDDVKITIFQNVGGNFDAPPVTNGVAVGSGTLSFDSCTSGSLSYTFTDGSGRSGVIPITRIAPNVTCAVGAAPPTNADFALSGNWFDAATSGQGFVFEVNPLSPIVFFAWYTYAPSGQAAGPAGQRWFTGSAAYTVGSRMIPLTLFETTGGVFDTATPPSQTNNPVGTATVSFMSCSTAQLQFNFTAGSNAGQAGMINLTRVGPAPAGCVAAASDPAPMMPGYGGYGP
jgi:hypothetical protein